VASAAIVFCQIVKYWAQLGPAIEIGGGGEFPKLPLLGRGKGPVELVKKSIFQNRPVTFFL
jgi:hypothetical protein